MTFLNNSSTARARIGKIFARWHVHLAIAIASTLNKYIHSAVQNDHSPVETWMCLTIFLLDTRPA